MLEMLPGNRNIDLRSLPMDVKNFVVTVLVVFQHFQCHIFEGYRREGISAAQLYTKNVIANYDLQIFFFSIGHKQCCFNGGR